VSLDIYSFWVPPISMKRIYSKWNFFGYPNINVEDLIQVEVHGYPINAVYLFLDGKTIKVSRLVNFYCQSCLIAVTIPGFVSVVGTHKCFFPRAFQQLEEM
jgi:hypothetical protein